MFGESRQPVSVLLNFARFYATTKHAGQLYAGALPYTHHLIAVEHQVRRWFPTFSDEYDHYHFTSEHQQEAWYTYMLTDGLVTWQPSKLREHLVAAAWLHDVIEDTLVKRKELEELFGKFVARVVWNVTDESGENRRIRHALTYPKIREFAPALFLKLCDRIANVEQGGSLVQMYRKEFEDFKRALYTPHLFEGMWLHLQNLLTPVREMVDG